MTPGWAAVIGVSVAVMAVVQLVMLAGLIVAMRRGEARLAAIERRMQSTLDEIVPQLVAILDEARGASARVQALAGNLQHRLDAMDDAARSVRTGVNRVADSVQWAATNLPLPAKVSAPAALAAWAGRRVVRALVDRARARRARRVA